MSMFHRKDNRDPAAYAPSEFGAYSDGPRDHNGGTVPSETYLYPKDYPPPGPQPKPKRRKRVFMWFFLAVQVIFLVWLITGIAGTGHSGADAHAQAVLYCARNSFGYSSRAACITQYGNTLNAASDAGKGIGAGLIVALWVAVDIILGIGRIVVVLARRRS